MAGAAGEIDLEMRLVRELLVVCLDSQELGGLISIFMAGGAFVRILRFMTVRTDVMIRNQIVESC